MLPLPGEVILVVPTEGEVSNGRHTASPVLTILLKIGNFGCYVVSGTASAIPQVSPAEQDHLVVSKPVISIVGRPNVGKSSLFNRIIGKRLAVVDDMPGVTRDRNYYSFDWNGESLHFVDTGGMLPSDHHAIPEAVHEQVTIAIAESDVIFFLGDVTTGPVDIDMQVAQILRKTCPEKTLCVVNKCESPQASYQCDAFRMLGLGTIYPVSAIHGNGVAEILDTAVELIRAKRGEHGKQPDVATIDLKLAVAGRPNAGKSSLVNMLLKTKRMIVDDQPGTTRDSIDSELTFNGKRITLIDTAGLRKKSHVQHGIEYYANMRALGSIERCDVCALVVDVTETVGIQDLRIIRKIIEMRKGLLLVFNKWDIMEKDHKTFDHLTVETRRQFRELQYVPMVSISALTGQRVTVVIETALKIKERMTARVPSSPFEDTFFSWVRQHPHPAIPENPVRFLGAKQIDDAYPHFRFFVANPEGIVPSYNRFLHNKIYESYDFEGCPLVLDYRPAKRAGKHESKEHLDADNSRIAE